MLGPLDAPLFTEEPTNPMLLANDKAQPLALTDIVQHHRFRLCLVYAVDQQLKVMLLASLPAADLHPPLFMDLHFHYRIKGGYLGQLPNSHDQLPDPTSSCMVQARFLFSNNTPRRVNTETLLVGA